MQRVSLSNLDKSLIQHVCVVSACFCVLWVLVCIIIALSTPIYTVYECGEFSGHEDCSIYTLWWDSVVISFDGQPKLWSYEELGMTNVRSLNLATLAFLVIGLVCWLALSVGVVWVLVRHFLGKHIKFCIPKKLLSSVLLTILVGALFFLSLSWISYLFSPLAWSNDKDHFRQPLDGGPSKWFSGSQPRRVDEVRATQWGPVEGWAFMLLSSFFGCVTGSILLFVLFPCVTKIHERKPEESNDLHLYASL